MTTKLCINQKKTGSNSNGSQVPNIASESFLTIKMTMTSRIQISIGINAKKI